jgi:hypothetical protein
MKNLTAADHALLAKRGKIVNGFTTTVNTEVRTAADRFKDFDFSPAPKKVKKVKKTKKVANSNANHPLVGRMLHTSWGYNMTINEFCKILEVSPTGKTVKCRMLTKEGFNGFTGTVEAGEKMVGPEFRLKIDGGDYFHGSYPYIVRDTKEESSFHMGYFGIYNGGKVYENHMD